MVIKDTTKIPYGHYCYHRDTKKKLIPCPYWSKRKSYKGKKVSPQENGFCNFLDAGDIELNADAIKNGIKMTRCKKGKVVGIHAFTVDDCPDWAKKQSLIWDMVKMCGINMENKTCK